MHKMHCTGGRKFYKIPTFSHWLILVFVDEDIHSKRYLPVTSFFITQQSIDIILHHVKKKPLHP